MIEKRKDNKGRVLKDGESQRKNGTYDYRYTDINKKRRCIYAKTLTELRKKEAIIIRDLADGIYYADSEITVYELVERYVNLKRGLKPNTIQTYQRAMNRIRSDPFSQRKIRSIKLSDAKGWFIRLHDCGFKQNTIEGLHTLLRPAFEMAVNDDILRKNPFKFILSEVIPKDADKRKALTKEQQCKYLQFIRDYGTYNYYDDIVILLGTGLRVSELYGLTRSDIDFENRRIHVKRQLCKFNDKTYFVTTPKTKNSIRCIPMTNTTYDAFRHVVDSRISPKEEVTVDGYTGFLFLDKLGSPKISRHLDWYMRNMYKKYVEMFGPTLPKVTPHVLRHTFCTNMQQAGLDVKSLQYLMGHASATITLDVYTHSDYDSVEKAFGAIAAKF